VLFDEESDTVTAVFELFRTRPFQVGFDTGSADTIEYEDTSIVLLDRPSLTDGNTTDKDIVAITRASTDADWPPVPKPPGERMHRRAGMYKAITHVTKLTKI